MQCGLVPRQAAACRNRGSAEGAMTAGVLAGFAIIGIIIGVGFLLAQLKILDATAQGVLTRVAFYLASPALMVTVLGDTDVHRLLSANLIASLGSVAVAATFAVLLTRLLWRREAGDTVIAGFCSAYINAGNLACRSPRMPR